MKFAFDTDEDTHSLLEIAVYFLQKYFGYDEQAAIGLVNQYHEKWRHIHRGDEYYHHEGAFHLAVRVHFFVGLGGDEQSFLQWRLDNGYMATPHEAADYFREHYFKK